MNRFFHLLLLAVITFNLGTAFANFGRQPTALLDRNAIGYEVHPPPPSPKPYPIPKAHRSSIYDYRFRTESIREQLADHHEADIDYPQFIEPAGRGQVAFNRFLEDRMRKNYAASSNRRRAAMRQREELPPVTERPLQVTYEVIYADEDLVSLKFTHRVEVAGKADPINYPETLNYDLARGRVIKLSDLFRSGSGYLPVIAAYSRGILEERYGGGFYVRDIAAPREANFELWNVSPQGLAIAFDESRYGELSIGQTVVIVPYDLLWDFIGRQSLINRFIDDC